MIRLLGIFACALLWPMMALALTVDGEHRKLVLVGVDGLQYEALAQYPTPNFDRLYSSRLYTGGDKNEPSQQKTSSGPGWSTILTGVWVQHHRVDNNDDTLTSAAPSLFDWVHAAYPQAVVGSVVRWGTIHNNLYSDMDFARHKEVIAGNDSEATAQFLNFLDSEPDFSFLQLDDIDHAGHEHGFGPEYGEAVAAADAQLGQILDRVESLPGGLDRYLVLVTTDHGRAGGGKSHGGQSDQERTVFVASSDAQRLPADGSPHTAVAALALDYLGIARHVPACAAGDLPCVFAWWEPRPLKVLQFNIWQEGTVVAGGYDAIVDEIIRSEADLIALSEVRNYRFRRFDKRLLKSLEARGYRYYASKSKDSGLISRYPILEQTMLYPVVNDHGSITRAIVNIDGVELAFYSAHLDYLNCSSYLPRGYDSSTWKPLPEGPVTDVAAIRADNAASMRDEAIDVFLEDARAQRQRGRIVILAGDFNEPSHRDWTAATAQLYDHNDVVMPWRNTLALEEAGMVDSFRQLYPDPVTHPGFTFPADNPLVDISKLAWSPTADDRERIDFIFFHPDPRLALRASTLVGPRGSILRNERVEEVSDDVFIKPLGVWPSDHKALLTEFELRATR